MLGYLLFPLMAVIEAIGNIVGSPVLLFLRLSQDGSET